MQLDSKNAVGNLLASARLVVGVSSWLTPSTTSFFSAMGTDLEWRERYLWRIFGIRDAALAVGVLTSEGELRRSMTKAALVSDFSDGVASLIGGRKAGMSLKAQTLHSTPGILGTVLGIATLIRER